MKNILFAFLLISTSFYAQNYVKNWDAVIENENNGKIKSANEIVAKIHKKAVADKNEVQIIKCFFYESKYLQVVDENAQTKILDNLQLEINQASIPSKAILNLVYAKCLSDYYNKNRYGFYRRNQTNSNATTFLTWTESDFEKQIQLAYDKTIESANVLKSTPLQKYEPIFDFLTLEKFKTQNLYDCLLRENISYYVKNIREYYPDPNKYNFYTKSLFGNSAIFTSLNLDFVKNLDFKKILQLYQNQESINPSAENELERIKFCNMYLLGSNTEFLKVLNFFQKNTKDEMFLQKIQFEKATIYTKLASKTDHPEYNIKAVSILDSIISVKNRSNAYQLAIQKKQQITSRTVRVQLEKYNYANEHKRALVNYKNIDYLKISFFKINQKTLAHFENRKLDKDSLVAVIMQKNKLAHSNTYNLVNKKDYFEYSTEILLPQLETGSYLAYFDSDVDEKTEKEFTYQTLTVSDFTILAQRKNDKKYYQVLNRRTGKPLENISIKENQFRKKTNSEGLAVFNEDENFRYPNNITEVSNANDSIRIPDSYLSYIDDYVNNEKNKFKAKAELYLDRAIYRPGQTVFYKGIVVQERNGKSTVVPNLLIKISVQDANDNDFKEFDVTTNEFGSFSGEFILPKSGLTGDFRMEADEPDDCKKDPQYDKQKDEHPFWDRVQFKKSNISFSVEEYKRPKFEVTFEPVKESYLMNQKITAIGKAKAFAGSNISDAKVTYTITRDIFKSYRSYAPEKQETLIQGETKTDASGKFMIGFEAKPSENSNPKELPVFSYLIKADITDLNGETHSSETTIKVGYHSLVLTANVPAKIETKNKNTIDLKSCNLNGQFVAVKGEVKIFLIRQATNKFKPRIWKKPEIEGISDADFNRLFPYELNEKPITEDEAGTVVYAKKVDTEKDKTILLDFISDYKTGDYKLEFSATDKFDNSITTSQLFYLTQSRDSLNPSKLLTAKQLNADPKKDGFISLQITSNIPELYINATGHYQGKQFYEQNCILKSNQLLLKIPIEKEFKNSIAIGMQSVFENQVFDEQLDVYLKIDKPLLKFDVESFRNKIEPGSKENWSFRLSSTNTSLKSEVLASMYDSALDQFATKKWNDLKLDDRYYEFIRKKTNLGFDKATAYLQNNNLHSATIDLKNEATKLIWFGFDFNEIDNPRVIREYHRQLNRKSNKPINAKIISGIIFAEARPLPGATITIKGTQRSAVTDLEGYYEIEAAMGEVLSFAYIGFEGKKIIVNSNIINVQLETDSKTLEEVIVVGYSSQKKSTVVGAVYQIDGEAFKRQGNIMNSSEILIRGKNSLDGGFKPLIIVDGIAISEQEMNSLPLSDIISIDALKEEKATALYGEKGKSGAIIITTKKALEALTQVKARKNLSETAFFYPNLKTDAKGKLSFNFTSPEALTAWKLRLLAHNKDAVSGYLEKSVITQKELMVTPNFPRFFREKDSIVITAKVANVTNEAKTGIAVLQLFDATTMQTADAKMMNINTVKNFNIAAYGNTTVSWKIYVPEGLQGVQYKVLAKAGNFSDGEENILPVLTNNMLVTESIPIWVRENSKREYTFENLKNNTSSTLKNHLFTLAYTSNPTWLAIQSLPYLMEYEHECAEQTFARFYANALASEIISSNPKISSLFETWRKNGKLTSKLEENEELKSMILAETPWLNDAKNEDEKKKNLALLFDLEKMKISQAATFDKLKQKQKASGGFAWFDGSEENEYITRHILAGLGHLSKLSNNENNVAKIKQIAAKGIPFLDQKFLQNYKTRTQKLKTNDKLIWLNPYSDLHYLYTRSFYLENYPLSDTLKKATKLYLETAKKDWLTYSLYEKGLAALTLNRFGERESAKKIIESLKETASNNEDWGMYWIANKSGWYWYQAPIETQALLIEAFAEVSNDTKSVDAMKVWLLKNKQTKNWPTTKSTTEAVYALLMQGTDWLSVKDNTSIKIGDQKILTKKLTENEKEAETGYVKLNWKADEIKKDMATVAIENKSKVPGFGGVYWQYFEDLDKIKNNSGASLSVSKELYLKKSTDKGEKLERITSNNPLQLGDLVTVRLIISAKEAMEFVHLKDMRASCFEPVDVLSAYQYKNGLGYYQSTKDAATHFFFEAINKGTYVLEYDVRVNNSGDFSNGITTIESMYAPEFSSHTKGIRVNVKKQSKTY
jgi:uncharacterized protein YfaS (alpha-2-macroglobulin family)